MYHYLLHFYDENFPMIITTKMTIKGGDDNYMIANIRSWKVSYSDVSK